MSVLTAPPKTLKDRLLKTLEVNPSTLFRISSSNSGESPLSMSASNREQWAVMIFHRAKGRLSLPALHAGAR